MGEELPTSTLAEDHLQVKLLSVAPSLTLKSVKPESSFNTRQTITAQTHLQSLIDPWKLYKIQISVPRNSFIEIHPCSFLYVLCDCSCPTTMAESSSCERLYSPQNLKYFLYDLFQKVRWLLLQRQRIGQQLPKLRGRMSLTTREFGGGDRTVVSSLCRWLHDSAFVKTQNCTPKSGF